MSAAELREAFLVPRLLEPGKIHLVQTDLDGLVVGGVMPLDEPLLLAPGAELETGILNIGGPGQVTSGAKTFALDRLDCLYVGSGGGPVRFEGSAWCLLSCPAHARRPTRKVSRQEAEVAEFGSAAQCSKRRVIKYIHGGGAPSCQLMMGVTEMEDGNVWNTMPPHTHSRRSEIYFYFDLGDQIVIHLMGLPDRTRHLIVRDREAVLSPRWSIHTGAGTNAYRFIWGMAGENRDFADIDPVGLSSLK